VSALRHARNNREFYGRRFSRRALIWEVVSSEEGEDYYQVRLSYRPVQGFRGEPGVEQFTIDKMGPIEFRQILSPPIQTRGPWFTAAVVVVLVIVASAVIGGLFGSGVLTGNPSPSAVTVFGAWVPLEPDAPATLESPDGDLLVTVPAGSIDRPMELRYSTVSTEQIPPLPEG